MKIFNSFKALTKFEWGLWLSSVTVVILSFCFGGAMSWLNLVASLVGVTALIFVARGDVLGQILVVVFSILYAIISIEFRYYGEMITYLGMTAPIAVLSIISWLRHPFEEGKNEVEIAKLKPRQIVQLIVLTILVTGAFYFILKFFNTANLIVSTISVATSFLASYLMLYRSPYYAIAYGMNDVVLIVLWVLATIENISYLPMVTCFSVFLLNDIYGFYNWSKMKIRQGQSNLEAE